MPLKFNPLTSNLDLVNASSSPGGSDTYVQFNDAGIFGGNSSFNYQKNIRALSLGSGSVANGSNSFAQGNGAHANGDHSAAFGTSTTGSAYAHAEGNDTSATALAAHSEGQSTNPGITGLASGTASHSEGLDTVASANYAHAEGEGSIASAQAAHAEGSNSVASGIGSHAEGGSTATGQFAHSEGDSTLAQGYNSHAAGFGTRANGFNQTTIGQFNIAQGTGTSRVAGDEAFIIGNGLTNGSRHNALSVTNEGVTRLWGITSGNIGHKAAGVTTNYEVTWPDAQGAASTYLSNDGTGTLTWSPITNVDSTFRIQDNGDATKKLAFEVSGIATATTRTITSGDENINISTGTSSSFANRQLGNLGVTAIGSNLNPSVTDAVDIGSAALSLAWRNIRANSFNIQNGGVVNSTMSTAINSPSGVANPVSFMAFQPGKALALFTTTNAVGASNDLLLESGNSGNGSKTGDIKLTTGTTSGTRGDLIHDAYRFIVPTTVTAGGTTGAQTINKMSGTVNFAATATTLVVTNDRVSTTSIVFAVIRTNDTTATIKNVVPAAGSFTITLTAAATAETSVGFFVINT